MVKLYPAPKKNTLYKDVVVKTCDLENIQTSNLNNLDFSY